jgi:hypothetical protein
MTKTKASARRRASKKTAPRTRSKPRGLLTRRELATLLDMHRQTVVKWEQEGMPIAERGSRGRASLYREVDVRAWLQLRAEAAKQPGVVTALQDRARKERAQAALAEQSYQMRMRDLLPRDEVEKTWAAEVAAVRTKLLAWTTTLADQVHRVSTIEGLPGVERLLLEAVQDVLRELTDPQPPVPGARVA